VYAALAASVLDFFLRNNVEREPALRLQGIQEPLISADGGSASVDTYSVGVAP
jgi:hypothetical protein